MQNLPEKSIVNEPIDIIVVSYERPNFLRKTVEEINSRTFYPFRLIVVDSGSKDEETRHVISRLHKVGKIQQPILLDENLGQLHALNEAFKYVKSELFITTQDDCLPPDLRPCWLERLVYLFEKHYPDYGSICMRIQRTRRLEWNEEDELIPNYKSMPSVYRIQKKSDIELLGEKPFGRLKHWESPGYANSMNKLKKKFAMATYLYADHIGFMSDNKGFKEGKTDYFTYSPERVKQGDDKPYAEIDPKTNIPIRLNHGVDKPEHQKRLDRWGSDVESKINEGNLSQKERLGSLCKEGMKCVDIGCGKMKCHPNSVGVDIYPHDCVDVVNDGDDLWFFKNEELDVITACHSLEHFADTKKVLKEWDRILKKDGIIGVIVPDGEARPMSICSEGHKVALTMPILRRLFKSYLRYKVLKLEPVAGLSHTKACILCVAQKI